MPTINEVLAQARAERTISATEEAGYRAMYAGILANNGGDSSAAREFVANFIEQIVAAKMQNLKLTRRTYQRLLGVQPIAIVTLVGAGTFFVTTASYRHSPVEAGLGVAAFASALLMLVNWLVLTLKRRN